MTDQEVIQRFIDGLSNNPRFTEHDIEALTKSNDELHSISEMFELMIEDIILDERQAAYDDGYMNGEHGVDYDY